MVATDTLNKHHSLPPKNDIGVREDLENPIPRNGSVLLILTYKSNQNLITRPLLMAYLLFYG
jgi:hypothetical protein